MYVPNQIAPAYVSAAIFNIFSHINSKRDAGPLLYPIKALYTFFKFLCCLSPLSLSPSLLFELHCISSALEEVSLCEWHALLMNYTFNP